MLLPRVIKKKGKGKVGHCYLLHMLKSSKGTVRLCRLILTRWVHRCKRYRPEKIEIETVKKNTMRLLTTDVLDSRQPEWMSWEAWHGLLTGKGHRKSIPTAQTHQIVIRDPAVTKTDGCVALEHTAKTTADSQLALMICAGPESKCLSVPRGSCTLYSFRGSGRQINRLLLW